MEWQTFEVRIFKAGQALEGVHIEAHPDGRRVRARVKRDAYDDQSTAVVEAWTAVGWQEILRRPISAVRVFEFAYASRGEDWKLAMRGDLDALVETGIRFLQVSK